MMIDDNDDYVDIDDYLDRPKLQALLTLRLPPHLVQLKMMMTKIGGGLN